MEGIHTHTCIVLPQRQHATSIQHVAGSFHRRLHGHLSRDRDRFLDPTVRPYDRPQVGLWGSREQTFSKISFQPRLTPQSFPNHPTSRSSDARTKGAEAGVGASAVCSRRPRRQRCGATGALIGSRYLLRVFSENGLGGQRTSDSDGPAPLEKGDAPTVLWGAPRKRRGSMRECPVP